MSIWRKLSEIADGGVSAVAGLFEWAGGLVGGIGDAETRRQVAFSVAMVALSAKMAKADGVVTADETAAFCRLFIMPPGEEHHVARLYNLAKGDVAGFESYASRVAAFYGGDREGLEDVLDGLFLIATADGAVHPSELAYLQSVGAILGFEGLTFERIAARHIVPEEGDPYLILGVDRSSDLGAIKQHYRKLAADNHPDRLIARGVPGEFVAIATGRLAAINGAFERIELERLGGSQQPA